MSSWLRRAGRGILPDGTNLLWSVAEGRAGRRWRSTTTRRDGSLALELLLEVDSAGHFSRLEMTSPTGMLTLHPESSGSRVDGNVVTPEGVMPISLPWSPAHQLRVAGSPIPELVTAGVRRMGTTWIDIVEIGTDLGARSSRSAVGEGSGRLGDPRGVPSLERATEWPLELEPGR